MERPIKFRAWDKLNKWMINPSGEVELNLTLYNADASAGYHFEYEDGKKVSHDTILMQFTGLLDNNGKEIYEGDIVRTGEEYGEVQYDPQQSSFIILFQPHNKKQKSGCANLASTWPSPLKEVIGNIHENPELLK